MEVHGNRYDYSKTNYIRARANLIVTCREHGDFEILASSHLSGANCLDCVNQYQRLGKKISWNTESWIEKAREVHGDTFIYSETIYIDAKTKVTILCPKHGFFELLPRHHIGRRTGCPICGGTQKMTTEEFIAASKSVHGDYYNYENTIYTNAKQKVVISCEEHGQFSITPSDHLYGQRSGCQSCAGNRALSSNEWIELANKIHDNIYEYKNQEWRSNNYIEVVCRIHGAWKVLVSNHIYRGSGCPICRPHGFNPQLPGYYYVNEITNNDGDRIYYKGGISNNFINRIKQLAAGLPEGMRIRNLESLYFMDGSKAQTLEKELLSIKEIRAPKRDFDGGSELFIENPLDHCLRKEIIELRRSVV